MNIQKIEKINTAVNILKYLSFSKLSKDDINQKLVNRCIQLMNTQYHSYGD